MNIQITPTNKITTLGEVPVRLWEGVTDQGVKCKVFVHRIAVHESEDSSAFERTLREQMPPPMVFDLRQVL
jgi:hypothetical protein